MSQLQEITDPTGSANQADINTQNIEMIIDELNRGPDVTMIARRTITSSQLKVISYQPQPFLMHPNPTLAAGAYATVVLNIQNNGLTALAGQTFLPVFYSDIFVDPPTSGSTAALYAGGNVYPDGANITSTMANLTYCAYLRNSTPGTASDVVSYVLQIRNQDSVAHAYWCVVQVLLPADGNLNDGKGIVYLP